MPESFVETFVHGADEQVLSENMLVERNVMIPMRDGIGLASDIYRINDGKRRPVMVISSPYDKDDFSYAHALMFSPIVGALRGYVVIAQNARGRYNSEGVWSPFGDEGLDVYDTVEWAAEQGWSNGAVGLYGNCAQGYAGLLGAVEQPPHLKAVYAVVTAANFYQGWTYTNGAYELGFNMSWCMVLGPDTFPRLGLNPEDFEEIQQTFGEVAPMFGLSPEQTHKNLPMRLPLIDYPGFRHLPYWREWLSHPVYDDYWRKADASARGSQIKVPVLHVTCWQDLCLKAHLDLYEALKNSDESVRDKHRFIIGPWDHSAYYNHRESYAGERKFNTATGPGFLAPLLLQWFDQYLKGEPAKVMADGNSVRYYQINEDVWKEDTQWPPAHKTVPYFLHSGGRANSRFGDGSLSTKAPEVEPIDSYVYDPMDPVLSVGGQSMGIPIGIYDQSEIEKRQDMLVFTTPRLVEPTVVAGPITVTLYASTDVEDTDFIAKLVDVGPDGYCSNITEGIVRGRFRNGTDHEEFLTPGEVTKFEVELFDSAWTFKKDHCIRLEISSSSFPRFDRNLNSRVSPGLGTAEDAKTAVQQIFHDSTFPSCLYLPVV